VAERTGGTEEDPLANYHPVEPQDAPDGESFDAAAPAPALAAAPPVSVRTAGRPSRRKAPSGAQAAAAAPANQSGTQPVSQPAEALPELPAPPPVVALNPIEAGAEVAVLTAILTDPESFDDISARLSDEDFGAPAHRHIYAAIVACDNSGRPFDPITVADELSRAGTLSQAGGKAYLDRLLTSDPAFEHISAYVDIILDRSLRRRMVGASRQIGATALDPKIEAADALNQAEHTMFEIGKARTTSSLAPMTLVMAKVNEDMLRARNTKIIGHSTGIDELDRVTGGLQGGQLIIVAARPGMGKTVIGMQIARHISEVGDLVVPFLSYEMSHSEIGFRLLSAGSGIDLGSLRRGHVPDGMDGPLVHEVQRLAQLRLHIDDRPPETISGVRSAMRRLARRGPLGAIVIDYIQLMHGDGGKRDENRTQEVGSISRGLKLLAGELDVPIIAISQLSRALESRPNRRPTMADLRESGALEQDANLILAVYRDWVYDRTSDERHAELLILKNRQGPQAQIAMDWEPSCVRFRNTDRTLDAPARRGPAGPAAGGGFGGFGGGGAAVVRPDIF
jgi:replicative DNA helicase